MKQNCIFCGSKPDGKNKEHIIPKWLIKMTGDLNRTINLGWDLRHLWKTGDLKLRTYSFNTFQFPSCSKCNSEFSNLETRVKGYFVRFFNKDYFLNSEIDDLLDWFDKVRIGLWLANIILDETIEDVKPKFYVKDRIGVKDRCLFIYEMEDDNQKGIQFLGTNSPGFHFAPSCFSLRVNNVYFFSYSFDFLFAKNIGFPYPTKMQFDSRPDRKSYFHIEKGLEKISLPLINYKFYPASTYIYQPIIPKMEYEVSDDNENRDVNHYNTDFVLANALNYEKGKGDIFYFDRKIFKLDDDVELQLVSGTQNLNLETFPKIMLNQTLKVLDDVINVKTDISMLSEKQQEIIKSNKRFILTSHRDFMKGARK